MRSSSATRIWWAKHLLGEHGLAGGEELELDVGEAEGGVLELLRHLLQVARRLVQLRRIRVVALCAASSALALLPLPRSPALLLSPALSLSRSASLARTLALPLREDGAGRAEGRTSKMEGLASTSSPSLNERGEGEERARGERGESARGESKEREREKREREERARRERGERAREESASGRGPRGPGSR
eukprot:3644142-Rhodomonas_salina.2